MSTIPAGPTPATRLLYSVEDAAEQLSLSTKEIRREILRGQLASVKVGRRRLIPAAALVDYCHRLEAGQ